MNRRRVLAALLPLVGVGSAGCLSSSERGASRLGDLLLTNRDDDPHTVDARVRWDGETVHESTHDLAANGVPVSDAKPERTWPDEPGRFTVSARLDGGEWQTVDPADRDYPDCYAVVADVSPDGTLALFVTTNERKCRRSEG